MQRILYNPFNDVWAGKDSGTPSVYVSASLVEEILPFCQDDEIRLALIFGRHAGVRMPSEVKNLRWDDIEHDRFHIRKGKTGSRVVPLFERVALELKKNRNNKSEWVFPKEDFPLLRSKLESGGRVLVLDHRSVPDFTSLQLDVTEGENLSHGAVAFDVFGNGILKGLTSEDLRFWNTMDEDLLVCFKGIRLPQRGNFRIYTRGGVGIKPEESGLIEAAVGAGSVVFVQMNLSRALGHDPAADRLLSNLLSEPGGFEYRPAAVIGDDVFVNALLGKTGLTATRLEDTKSLDRYQVLILDAEKLSGLSLEELRNWVRQGGTVFLPNIRSENKDVIASLLEKEVGIEEAAHDRAYILRDIDVLAGLSHGDFFWTAGKLTIENRHITPRDLSKTQAPSPNHTGHFVLAGETITPWLYPAYLSEAKMEKGRIILSTLRLFDYPVSETRRIKAKLKKIEAYVCKEPLIVNEIGTETDIPNDEEV